ncbi:DNA-directed RNA polymerase subunit beta [Patescibacteria group bacterium]|nr:DNA-directed RNA polymerase subunit beta [Patescibacteria group bacterium]
MAKKINPPGPADVKRVYFGKQREWVSLPDLNTMQTSSYNWFFQHGLRELFDEISPIDDFTGKTLSLQFGDYYLDEPKHDEFSCRERNFTYKSSLRCQVSLINKETGEIKEQEVFMGDFPLMTSSGSFIINGIERVVVSQIIRSPGVLFTSERTAGQEYFGAKVIPDRGAWLEIETNNKNIIYVKIDRKRKIPITTLLRAFGLSTDENIVETFKDVSTDEDRDYIKTSLIKDPADNHEEGLLEVYKRIRPGDLATVENAQTLIEDMFFNFRRYDFGKVGRYKINKRLNLDTPNDKKHRTISLEDLISVVKEVIRLNLVGGPADDIDNLKNRRVRCVGELAQKTLRVGLLRMERIVKDRMSVSDINTVTPSALINVRPLTAALQEFFASSQFSHFMDQTNPLAELENKRRITAMGPGGLSRERAGFEVRDVHHSHYGRLCPIQTPEGSNIGLVSHLSCFANINEYGFIVTPYHPVIREVPNDGQSLTGHIIREKILDPDSKQEIATAGTVASADLAQKINKLKFNKILVEPQVQKNVVYLDSGEEEDFVIAQADIELCQTNHFVDELIASRNKGEPDYVPKENIDYISVSPKQIFSVATALIPFVENDEGTRSSMGSNMLRQAVSLINPESPIVGTGMEEQAALDSGEIITAEDSGEVISTTGNKLSVKYKNKKTVDYNLRKFIKSNQGTCINQHLVVQKGDKVKKGQLLADGTATDNGELALGQNILVAFMPWGGYNFQDAVIVSERLVHNDSYSSIHIENHLIEVRETKLGPEIITRDIPNVGEEALKNLDADGIIRLGAEVTTGDILVGKITPKGETELSAEEKLLRAIFGEKARDVKDTSLRLPHGERGKIVNIKIFTRDKGDELSTGVTKAIEVSVAQLRKIQVGDKMAGRHGNKGVISRILPTEDMPYLPDGTPVDIILNPLGVISRINLGQVMETHLGWAAKTLGYKVACPVFESARWEDIKKELSKAGLPESGKIKLFDGRTGKPFDQEVTVGYIYMMKLHHLVEDKMHARSIGPYSMITQQPLGGKAQFGGQRFGEMEVWALQAYGAAHTLQEMITIKSDDVIGRSKAYESIIKGEDIKKPTTPESFNVLRRELQGLGLKVDLIDSLKRDSRKK